MKITTIFTLSLELYLSETMYIQHYFHKTERSPGQKTTPSSVED